MATHTATQTRKPAMIFSSMDFWMIALVIVWGLNFVLIKQALSELSALVFMALRFGLGTLLMLVIWYRAEPQTRIVRADWAPLLALSLIGHTLYQALFVSAIKFSTVGNTSLILATAPIWVALFSALRKIDPFSKRAWCGVWLSFAGLTLIIRANGPIAFGSGTLLGDLLMLGAAICWGAYAVLAKPFLQKYSATTFTTWTMVAGGVPLFFIGLPDLLQLNLGAIHASTWLTLLYSASLAIAIGYIIWNAGIARLGQARTAVYSNLVPIVALVIGVIFLGEDLTWLKLSGAAIVLTGLSVARRG